MFFALLCVAFLPVKAEAKPSKENKKYAAFVLDADTGLILHQENATKPLHPASLTKMMTLLMAFDALDRGVLKLNDRIRISKHAASMEPSKLGLKPGSSIRVEDAILALVTKSANDIAVAVGERLGGTETNFGVMMTRKARAFGMKSTTFVNASGLHNPKQITTARDMARLGLVLIKNYKRHYHYFSTANFSYQGKSYHNHNRLMQSYEGMDGLKTGFIQPSGFNLVASAKRDGRRLIGVVFGGKTAKSRNDRMAQILNEGFAKIGTLNVAEAETKKSVKTQTIAALEGEDDPTPSSQMGQGDFDSSVRTSRVETGMMAVAAVTGTPRKQSISVLQKTPEIAAFAQPQVLPVKPPRQTLEPPPKLQHKLKVPQHYTTNQGGEWAIQVGAYTSRESSNKALNESLKRLPASMRNSNPVVAPVQTAQGWIFRARLSGFTKDTARKACSLLAECIPIAPHAAR